MVGMLGALRMLPEIVGHLLHGERPAKPPESMRLRDLPSIPMYEGGWILLGERAGHEIALGLVGKFWRPVIEFARITSPDEFRDFDEPGFAKTVYDLSVRELGATTVSITHDMTSARRIADRIAMLHKGRIVWQGPASEIDRTDNPFVDQFVHGRAEGPIQMEVRAA